EEALGDLEELATSLQTSVAELDGRLDPLEAWGQRIKGIASSAPTPGPNTQVGDIYLAAAPEAGGNIGWVCVEVSGDKVFKEFGAIAE
ncbi:MAG: hypothetical protein NZ934_02800, partial [Hadesarchaea archaeon]|nr:hypothetical protein [Hadesarchaea archaeon]